MSALGSIAGLAGSLFGGGGGGMIPGSSASANDSGFKMQNTPVVVIAGNSGTDLGALVNAAANLSWRMNEPVEQALSQAGPSFLPGFGGASPGPGGLPGYVWLVALAGGALLLLKR